MQFEDSLTRPQANAAGLYSQSDAPISYPNVFPNDLFVFEVCISFCNVLCPENAGVTLLLLI
jgi:hypothetical protein